MRGSIHILVAVMAGLAFGVSAVSISGADDERLAAAPAGAAGVQIPSSWQADLHERLGRRISIDYRGAPLDEVLGHLRTALGADIVLEGDVFENQQTAYRFSLKLKEPVTIFWTLREIMRMPGGSQMVTLDDGKIKIINFDAAANRCTLGPHELHAATNYSTALRARFIEQVRREITPDAWGQAGGSWIVPGHNVYEIDVFCPPGVHSQIFDLWQKQWTTARAAGNGKPVAALSASRFSFAEMQEKSGSEVEAVVRQLQAEFPLESMTARLKYEDNWASHEPPSLAPAVEKRLAEGEGSGSDVERYFRSQEVRVESLKRLHSSEVTQFVSRPGNGVARMPQPSPSQLPASVPQMLVLPSHEIDPPSYEEPVRLITGKLWPASVVAMPASELLDSLHGSALHFFISPERNGYIRDREHVAGFASHAFRYVPRLADPGVTPQAHWPVRRLELVSLLKHDTPQVYVSDSLPRMDELAETRTRPLSAFESGALRQLRATEDVVIQGSTNRIEMVGALRADKNCLECHQVQRGQLLGAFSYILIRDPLVTPKTAAEHREVF